MVTTAHDIGDVRRLQATFKDTAAVLTDPTTVTFKIREPDGTITTKIGTGGGLVNPSTGVWYFDFTIAQQGRHSWSMEGTGGGVIALEEQEFYARVKDTS